MELLLDIIKPIQPFLAGGIGGGISMTFIMPVDSVKVRLQLAGEAAAGAAKSPIQVARTIVAESGVGGLWRGLGAAWLRQMVYGSTRIGLFRMLSEKAKAHTQRDVLSLAQKVGLGATAGALAAIVGTPADVSLVRMQADNMAPPALRRNYTGVFNALGRIVKEEGVLSLWRGTAPTVVRAMVLNAALLSTADQMKEFLAPYLGGINAWSNIAISSLTAGVVAAVVSLPADMVKTRLQNMKPDAATGKFPYAGLLDCTKQIIAREGPAALFTGLPTYVVRIAPYGLITLLCTDALTIFLNGLREKAHTERVEAKAAAAAAGTAAAAAAVTAAAATAVAPAKAAAAATVSAAAAAPAASAAPAAGKLA